MVFPELNPIALQLGPIAIRWYGLMYILAFLLCWLGLRWQNRGQTARFSHNDISDLIFYAAIGVIVGGRIGYVFFYQFSEFMHQPLMLFKTWQGGMSFHGGLIGVMLSLMLWSYRNHKPFLDVADLLAPLVPIGLFLGRIGNFINGELWGRPSDVPWAMIFPHVDALPRHPSQLYEALGEGVLLFIILQWFARKPRVAGQISAAFLLGYSTIRFGLEFTREPDFQLGFIAFAWLTMGQLLSLAMFAGGVYLLWYSHRHQVPATRLQ